jgi:hypothetical protein
MMDDAADDDVSETTTHFMTITVFAGRGIFPMRLRTNRPTVQHVRAALMVHNSSFYDRCTIMCDGYDETPLAESDRVFEGDRVYVRHRCGRL